MPPSTEGVSFSARIRSLLDFSDYSIGEYIKFIEEDYFVSHHEKQSEDALARPPN